MPHAIRVHAHGGPEVLQWEGWDPGTPGTGELRVRVAAAGVNFIDVYYRTGLYPMPLPYTAGVEAAGVVEAVGDGVDGVAVGDRVAWCMMPGSYAEVALVPAAFAVRVPAGVDDPTAAASMLQGMTAHYLTHGVRTTSRGDVALVHAAAGGTGLLLVQMLKAAGATVIGTCSTEEKAALAAEAGCDHVVRYVREDVADAVRRITGGEGAHVVYDSVGQSTFDASLASLRVRGLLALFGQSSGPVPPFDLRRLSGGSFFVTRPSLAHYARTRAELDERAGAVLELVERGQLRVRVGARFPLRDAAAAHRALEGRETTGKVLLIP
jgi:NADPH2:quinone reductase